MKKIIIITLAIIYSLVLVSAAGNDINTVLLISSDTTDGSTTFTDSSVSGNGGAGHTINLAGDVHHETDNQYFGASSIYFDGTDDSLTMPSSGDWDFGTGDYTIDFWINFQTIPTTNKFKIFEINGNEAFMEYQHFTKDLLWGTNVNNEVVRVVDWGDTAVTDQWYHFAIIGDSGTMKIYIDGTYVSTGASDTVTAFTTGALTIGETTIGPWVDLHAYIDEFRISDIARWTSDFTPPTSPHHSGSSQQSVPEFNFFGIILILTVSLIGLFVVHKKNEEE